MLGTLMFLGYTVPCPCYVTSFTGLLKPSQDPVEPLARMFCRLPLLPSALSLLLKLTNPGLPKYKVQRVGAMVVAFIMASSAPGTKPGVSGTDDGVEQSLASGGQPHVGVRLLSLRG